MFMRIRLAPVLLASCALAALIAEHAAAQKRADRFGPAWEPVRSFFHETLQQEGVVGGTLVFFHGDTVLAREFHGFADLGTKRPVDERTIYHWASITKTFTAVSLMQLRDRQRLTLDDPIVRYLPELRAVHDSFGPMDAVTLRQLLSHSAGFRNGTWPWGGDQPWQPFEPTQWSQLVAMLPYTEVLFAPGSRYSYSNPGFIFLGRVIEQLTDDDYEVYVEKNVLRPLGMSSSYFDRTPYHLLPYRSNNYDVKRGVPVANGLDFDTGITVSNGGLNAPVTDMLKWLQFLADAPGVPETGRRVLAHATLEEMWRPVLPLGGTEPGSIGLSFFLLERNGVKLVGHTGSQRAFRSFFYIDPVSKAGALLVMNTAPTDDPRNPTDQGPERPRIPYIFDGLLQRLTAGVFPLYQRP